jgi:hypothetical protein
MRTPKKHEWIPTNYVAAVLERAATNHDAGLIERGLNWVRLQHALRSRTNLVIWHIENTTPQGHAGAFWEQYQRGGKSAYKPALTTGSEDFHDKLRASFDAHQDSAASFVDSLLTQLPALIWTGDLGGSTAAAFRNMPIDALYDTGGGKVSLTVQELADQQVENYRLIQDDFERAKAALHSEG